MWLQFNYPHHVRWGFFFDGNLIILIFLHLVCEKSYQKKASHTGKD